jgi:hypothetical protein
VIFKLINDMIIMQNIPHSSLQRSRRMCQKLEQRSRVCLCLFITTIWQIASDNC